MRRTNSKDVVLDAKVGKTFITNEGRYYYYEYRKEGRKYIFTIIYNGQRMQVSETDFYNVPMDTLLKAIENETIN